jgi:hypothetical protein
MTADPNLMFPVITNTTVWHQQYYLRRFGYKGPIVKGDFAHNIDSFKSRQLPFWLTAAHGAQPPSRAVSTALESSYLLLKNVQLFDAWGQLYVPKSLLGNTAMVITARDFPPEKRLIATETDQSIALWWPQRLDFAPAKLLAGK